MPDLLAWRFPLLALALAAFGCGERGERRAEAERALRAFDALVAAPPSGKAAPLALLGAVPVVDPDVRAMRDACLAAFGPLVKADALGAKVRAALEAHDGAPETLAPLLDRADQATREARDRMPRCLAAATQVRQVHRL